MLIKDIQSNAKNVKYSIMSKDCEFEFQNVRITVVGVADGGAGGV